MAFTKETNERKSRFYFIINNIKDLMLFSFPFSAVINQNLCFWLSSMALPLLSNPTKCSAASPAVFSSTDYYCG
jgi:hypothetical protein